MATSTARFAALVIASSVGLMACGHPTEPDATLTIDVIANHSHVPMQGIPLEVIADDGGRVSEPSAQTTDAGGSARWTVRPGHRYSVKVRGERFPFLERQLVKGAEHWTFSVRPDGE